MDQEEFPLWDWRRTRQLETALGQSEERNTVSRADLSAARQQIQTLQGLMVQADQARQAAVTALATAQSKIQTLETDRATIQVRLQSIETRLNRLETPPAPMQPAAPSPTQEEKP